MTTYVLPLADLTRADAGVAGSKAANLGDLLRAGFPVPEGFVLTTAAFERFLAANALGFDATPEAVRAAQLLPDVEIALRSAAAGLDGVALAVRSSAVAEDLAGASFAGQYETVLGVRGPEAVCEAVKRCWASAFSARVAAYRKAREPQQQPARQTQEVLGAPPAAVTAAERDIASVAMAVLVQRLVEADAAGVAFTANPVTGDRGEVVVSAVRGLGERLVSGQVTPDEWGVRDRPGDGSDDAALGGGADAVCRLAPDPPARPGMRMPSGSFAP